MSSEIRKTPYSRDTASTMLQETLNDRPCSKELHMSWERMVANTNRNTKKPFPKNPEAKSTQKLFPIKSMTLSLRDTHIHMDVADCSDFSPLQCE